MCEIYGFSGNQKKELNTDLHEFYSHANEHPNGWGLALFNEQKTEILREVVRADQSDYLKEQLSKPIITKTALAHIRLATIGNVEYDNCHPFTATDNTGRTWTLIHNGTIFESEKLKEYIFRQKGETDSERILLYIIDCINEQSEKLGRSLTAEERFSVLDKIISNSSPKNKLNLLIYDGEILYAHTNFRNSLYFLKDNMGVTVSTRPLTEKEWQEVTFTTLIGWIDGKLSFTGTNHHNEYFYDPNSYTPLYITYSGL